MSKTTKVAAKRGTATEQRAARHAGRIRSARSHSWRRTHHTRRTRDVRVNIAAVVVLGVAALAAIFYVSGSGGSSVNARDAYPFVTGDPGPGQVAPPMRLAATDGTTFDLEAYRGETVLLFFQEGLMCQPCWDQIVDMEANWDRFSALGIDRMVSITTDPLDLLEQKVNDEGIETPLLSDPDLAVSLTYTTNLYGMMGTSMNGHSFIVVGASGEILWRADYGGAPKYTMYVPTDRLLADMRGGLERGVE